MTTRVLWTLPVPSTALEDGGPAFTMRSGREVSIRLAYESEEDATRCATTLVFEGVEAFKCTYHHARDASTLQAYDRLIDLGETLWLAEVRKNLERKRVDARSIVHMLIDFDDGPAYELLCRSFRVETESQA
jgi:hypothetical protein